MKKIIKGSVYNTETAHKVGCNDLYALYKNKARKYFLYDKSHNEIISLTWEEAKVWTEKYTPSEEYNAEFGTADKNTKDTLMLSLPIETKRKLECVSSQQSKSISQIIIEMVNNK
ncbi:MAG: hypothetical protein WCS56_02010 [Bacilli bacterium]